MSLVQLIQCCGLAGMITGAVIVGRLKRHIDPIRFRETNVDPARTYSNIGPTYEVLSDRGRRLLSISFCLIGLGLVCLAAANFAPPIEIELTMHML